MYAITSNGYRCIVDASELLADETATDTLPASLLIRLAAQEARARRDILLVASDWTQGSDSPLLSTEKAAWTTYRQALRDVPQRDGFPTTITWPSAP